MTYSFARFLSPEETLAQTQALEAMGLGLSFPTGSFRQR